MILMTIHQDGCPLNNTFIQMNQMVLWECISQAIENLHFVSEENAEAKGASCHFERRKI